jgi:hypothetical protein
MRITKIPVGVGMGIAAIVLAAKYGVFTSAGACATVAICALILLFGWMAPVQIMRD